MSVEFAVRDAAVDGDLGRRRRLAAAEASADARAGLGRDPRGWTVMLRRYGEGCLVVALAGTFDRAGLARLRALRADLHRVAHTELVVELSSVDADQPGLARVVAALRVSRLAAGARVELHEPSDELRAELGVRPAEIYTVRDDEPIEVP